MSIDPSYQVVLSQREFGSGLTDSNTTGFTKYNQHSHRRLLPQDPRRLDIREGDIVYILDNDSNSAFPDDTTVTSVNSNQVEVSDFANSTVENTLYLLEEGQDPNNDPSVLDEARSINNVKVNSGESSFTLNTKDVGSVSSEQLRNISYTVVRGSIRIGELTDQILIPEGFYESIRLVKYQFNLLPNSGSTLEGELSLRLVHTDGNTLAESDLLNVTLNSNNSYEESGFDLDSQKVTKQEDSLEFIFDTTTASSSQDVIDLEQYSSLGELIQEGLDNNIGSLSYWLEFIKVVV